MGRMGQSLCEYCSVGSNKETQDSKQEEVRTLRRTECSPKQHNNDVETLERRQGSKAIKMPI